MLSKLEKSVWLVFFLAWPWQTRYFLHQGANEYLTTSFYASDIIVLILLLLFIFRIKLRISARELLNYFFLGLVPVAILAIVQFSLQTSFSTKWLGLAKHDPAELGQVVIETAQGERWLRAYGSFDHPNILGGVMAVVLLFLLVYKKEKWGLLENVYTALFATALFFSFSRTAWLGLFLGAAIYLGINYYKKEKVNKTFFVISAIIYFLFSIFYFNLLFARVTADGRIEQKSISERASYYSEAKALFLADPYFGVGLGNYVSALMEMKPGQPAWSYQPVHNVFVLMLVELGLVGVFLILSVLIFFGIRSKEKLSRYWPVILPPLFLLLVIAMFDHWLWSLHVGWLLIAIIFFLIKKHPLLD